MNTRDVLVEAFGRTRGEVAGAMAGLDAEGLAWQPDPEANSIGWLVWHLTRVQDDHVSHLGDRQQAYVTDGWAARLGLDPDPGDLGYGHTPEQVGAVRIESAEVLLAYFDAVAARTDEYLEGVDGAELARVVDTRWDPPVTALVRLVSVIDDCAQHAGQANYVRGMWDRRSSSSSSASAE